MSDVRLQPKRTASFSWILLFLACPGQGRAEPGAPPAPPPGPAHPTPHHDCNGNGIEDMVDIALGTSSDADLDGVPDECQAPRPGAGPP